MPNVKATTAMASAIALTAGLAIGAPAIAAGAGGGSAASSEQAAQTGGGTMAKPEMKQGQQWTKENLQTRADEIIGDDVANQDGTEVGEVQDIVLDKQNDEPHAVISVGGVMGLGGKEIVVPFDQLTVGEDRVTLMSQKSEEELEAMPAYQEDLYTPIQPME